MSVQAGPNLIENGLRVSYDAGNIRSYPGSGNTLFSLNGRESATATTISTAIDSNSGIILNHNTSTSVSITLSPVVNHEVWSIMFWVRSTGLTSSNYRSILTLDDTNSAHNYFYNGNQSICRVYNRALSAAEISQNFNALRGRYGV